jgi:FtsH-binding integral membrane protein
VFNRNPNDPNRADDQGGWQTPPSRPGGWGNQAGGGRPASPFGGMGSMGGFGTSGIGFGGIRAGTATGVMPREGFLTMSFVWMFMALLVSAAAAAFVLTNTSALTFVVRNYFMLAIASLVVALVVQLGINRIGTIPALAGLFIYSLLMGLTIGAIVTAYVATGGIAGVVSAFLGASAIFGAAALYGVVTKRDLTRLGGILFMAFIGLFVMSIANIFIGGGTLSYIIGIVGVVIFTGLTAYYVQQLNNGGLNYIASRESASIVGALLLYITFINLFLMLLRLFGGNRR